MKKLIALLLALVMVLALAACAAKTKPAKTETTTETTTTTSTLRDLLLNATIRDVGIDSLLVEGGVAGMSGKELGCYGSTYSEDMTLSERTRCVFNAACNLKFRVTCSW